VTTRSGVLLRTFPASDFALARQMLANAFGPVSMTIFPYSAVIKHAKPLPKLRSTVEVRAQSKSLR
jgi:hypothetical protein